jgi:hypothetical protein
MSFTDVTPGVSGLSAMGFQFSLKVPSQRLQERRLRACS